MKSISRRSVI